MDLEIELEYAKEHLKEFSEHNVSLAAIIRTEMARDKIEEEKIRKQWPSLKAWNCLSLTLDMFFMW